MEVYDLIRKVKNHLKVKKSLSTSDSGPRAGDISNFTYQVINHKKGEVTKVDFTLNPSLLKAKQVIKEKTEIPKDVINT